MEFEAIGTRALRESVFQRLRQAILEGRLRPGDRLLETEIARQMRVSRAPVREALRLLESDGLVATAAHRGTFVTSVEPEECRELYELRAVLEGYAARLVVRKGAAPQDGALGRLIDEMRAAADQSDAIRWAEANFRFHEGVLALTANAHIARVWQLLGTQMLRFFHLRERTPGELRAMAEEHVGLLAALAGGDAQAAERAFRLHIEDAAQRLFPGRRQA
jgi:GntR family transcriptional regulator of gluconate operon